MGVDLAGVVFFLVEGFAVVFFVEAALTSVTAGTLLMGFVVVCFAVEGSVVVCFVVAAFPFTDVAKCSSGLLLASSKDEESADIRLGDANGAVESKAVLSVGTLKLQVLPTRGMSGCYQHDHSLLFFSRKAYCGHLHAVQVVLQAAVGRKSKADA